MTRNRHETDFTLFAFSDESLSLPDTRRVVAHLAGCPLCDAQVSRYRQIRDLVAFSAVASNAGWTVREIAEAAGHSRRVQERTPAESPRRRRMNSGISIGSIGGILKHRATGMAAALLLGGAAGYWISDAGSSTPNLTSIVLRGSLILGRYGLSRLLGALAVIAALVLTSVFPREQSRRERSLPLLLWSLPLGHLLFFIYFLTIGDRALRPWPPTTAPGNPWIFLYLPMFVDLALDVAFLGLALVMAAGKDRVRKIHGCCGILYFAVSMGPGYLRWIFRVV